MIVGGTLLAGWSKKAPPGRWMLRYLMDRRILGWIYEGTEAGKSSTRWGS